MTYNVFSGTLNPAQPPTITCFDAYDYNTVKPSSHVAHGTALQYNARRGDMLRVKTEEVIHYNLLL